MSFIHDDFLLETKASRKLYGEYAAGQPILDYHCHLSPADIAEDRRFENLFEIWLKGDHYKWRAMRANGIAERYCTGDAEPYEKFSAWASTTPHCLRNPLYHWTHLELKRYFDIDEQLSPTTAQAIWNHANELLRHDGLSTQGILERFDVRALCTTDDPADDLSHHATIASSRLKTRVFPTFRPDRALAIHQPEAFNLWAERLSKAADMDTGCLRGFLGALRKRHQDFHAVGCCLSDHGLAHCFSDPCTEHEAAVIFDKVRSGRFVSSAEHSQFASFMMLFFGHLDAEKGWTKQLHLGALRSVSTRGAVSPGPDTGFDSIGDFPQVQALGKYLDRLDTENALPKTIVYNVNPSDNYAIATLIGNFQGGSSPARLQWGSAWWFLDQKEGMEWQLNTLSNTGLLSRFVGMLTDSRSFMSYPRHEYFRRVLCNVLGREMESGELPDDEQLIGGMVRDICYGNACRYLGLDVGPGH